MEFTWGQAKYCSFKFFLGEKRETRGGCLKPVPILQFWRTTSVDSVIWIPSVFGLSPGAEICISDNRTEFDLETTKCICWLFRMVRPFTLTAELESIVNACNVTLHVTSEQKEIKQVTIHVLVTNLHFCNPLQLFYKTSNEENKILTVGAALQGCQRNKRNLNQKGKKGDKRNPKKEKTKSKQSYFSVEI